MTMGAPPIATPVPQVRVAEPGMRHDLRAIKIVLHRELLRFVDDKVRMGAQLFQPLLWLLVMGTGLASLMPGGTGGVNLKTFMFPGVIAMSVMFTGMFSAASIVWDREFGFLREMMVAPVRRSSIVLGKCLGGATVASLQGAIIIAIGGLVGIPYLPVLVLEIVALTLLLSFSITAFGVMAAARVTQMQSFMALMQMIIMPMFFLAGALFPVSGLPRWLEILNRVDPLTYAVDPMRRAVFAHLDISPAARHALVPGVTWFGWNVPSLVEVGVVALLGCIMLGIAIAQFARTE
jgi:ABC-2 type transport system permease protein